MTSALDQFEIAGGSVIGKKHRDCGKNNQDAYNFNKNIDSIVGVVCDGCGSGLYSEFGSRLGAKFLTENIANTAIPRSLNHCEFSYLGPDGSVVENFCYTIRGFINSVMVSDLVSYCDFIENFLLFTIVGFVVNEFNYCVFSIGDGVYQFKEKLLYERKIIGPFKNNAPPYLAYKMHPKVISDIRFNIHHTGLTSDLMSIIVGTDGVVDMIKSEDINQFVEKDMYFKNPDAIRRKLFMMNKERALSDGSKYRGILNDDTTVVALRRKL